MAIKPDAYRNLFAKTNLFSSSCRPISFQNLFILSIFCSQLPGLRALHAQSTQKRINLSPQTSKQTTWRSHSNTNQPNYTLWFPNINVTSHSIVSLLSVFVKRGKIMKLIWKQTLFEALSLLMDFQSLAVGSTSFFSHRIKAVQFSSNPSKAQKH